MKINISVGPQDPEIHQVSYQYQIDVKNKDLNTIINRLPQDQRDQLNESLSNIDEDDNFLVIKMNNDVDAHNLYKVLSRKKHEKFFIDGQGKLQTISGFWQRFSYKKEVQEPLIRDIFAKAITQLNSDLSSRKDSISDIQKVALQAIFFGDLARVSKCSYDKQGNYVKGIYDRWNIEENSALDQILAPEVVKARQELIDSAKELRDAKSNRLKNPNDNEAIQDYFYAKEIFEKSLLQFHDLAGEYAIRLGIKRAKNGDGGSGGAVYEFHHLVDKQFTNANGVQERLKGRIFVVKPENEGPHGSDNPHILTPFKRALTAKNGLKGNLECVAEEDSYKLSQKMHLNLVPPTMVRTVNDPGFSKVKTKEASLQMFVEGCDTLGGKIKLSEGKHWMPNWFLRWYITRNDEQKTLVNSVPQELLEVAGVHNKLAEDTDSHFGNLLFKEKETSDPTAVGLLDESVFESKEEYQGELPTDEDIETFFDQFFSTRNNQKLLQEYFRSKDGKILVKHDGGATHPHTHPTSYIERRFEHLFTIMPQFDGTFSDKTRAIFKDRNQEYASILKDKAIRELEMINVPDRWIVENEKLIESFVSDQCDKQFFDKMVWHMVFSLYYPKAEKVPDDIEKVLKETAKKFDLEKKRNHKTESKDSIIVPSEIVKTNDEKTESKVEELVVHFSTKDLQKDVNNCLFHLKRIKAGIEARKDCWKVTAYHLEKENNKSMHELFSIKSNDQFREKIKKIDKDTEFTSYKKVDFFNDESLSNDEFSSLISSSSSSSEEGSQHGTIQNDLEKTNE